MHVTDRGSYVIVSVSEQEVREFNSRWPCSTVPEQDVAFFFEKATGDLFDMEPPEMDGEAVAALSQDAQEFAGL